MTTPQSRKWPEYRRRELTLFAARVRASRGVLNWSQTDLATRAGLTQRCIYKIENVSVDVRDSTVAAISKVFRAHGIYCELTPGGGFHLRISEEALNCDSPKRVEALEPALAD